ncbi:MAG TPA: isoamylase early set domain-containing protein [Candidatus Krumholzibacteria bacterium]|nr:isoamylase early set domain-containing protein [Candidatus Krumholzibacteria bacterium]
MKFKQVVELLPGSGRPFGGRLRRIVRALVALRVALLVVAYPSALSAGPLPASGAPISTATADAVERDLAGVFRAQDVSGTYTLAGPMKDFARYPVFANMSWDAHRSTGNTAALSQAAYSIARYYGYLFATSDSNGNHLIETPAPWGDDATRVEDPGFNSLLALDALRLARINLSLRRTMPALFWYDGARSIERAVVMRTFDPEAGYFFPIDVVTGRFARHLSAVSALPASFDGLVGGNHLDMVVARHLAPWALDLRIPGGTKDTAPFAVERMAAASVLAGAGRSDALAHMRAQPTSTGGGALAAWASQRALGDEPLADRYLALDLLYTIARASGKLADGDVVRLESGIAVVKDLCESTGPSPSLEDGARAVRDIYTAVSILRERLKSTTFWSPADRTAYPGVDPGIAAHRLTDDALFTVRRAENRLFEMRYGRVVTASLASPTAVEGEDVLLKWEVAPGTSGIDIAAIDAGVAGESLSPLALPKGTALSPGAAPLHFSSRYRVQSGAGSLHAVTFMLSLTDAGRARARYYAERTVFVQPPVSVVARFPQGRAADGRSVPIEVSLTRHSRKLAIAKYFWFSPSGLRLVEGNQGEIQFSATDSIRTTLHVEIPSPCRPGVFPFTLKFMSGDRDAGTIAATLFKPYQWAALGPFPASGGLDGKLPPEISVGLLQTYAGAEGMLAWRPVPAAACGPRGEIRMRDAVPGDGISYLYTVVGCSYETEIEAHLSADCRAALFVNGRRMAVVKAPGDSATTVIHLDADRNHILIKAVGGTSSQVTFALGNKDNLAADEFNNDLSELAEGYSELVARANTADGAQPETHRLVTFRLQDAGAESVAVVGSFNGWSPQNHRLQKRDKNVWEITLSLAPGRYAYRFLIDQKKQVLDPSTPLTEPDGFGGRNSVVIVSR